MKFTGRLLSLLLVTAILLTLLPTASVLANAEETTILYPVEGGSLIFDPTTGTITGCSGDITVANIPDEINGVPVAVIGDFAFALQSSLIEVHIPDSVTIIAREAFAYCSNMTTLTMGNSVTTIEEYAFMVCNNLSNLTIPDSVTSIGDSAFYACYNLKSIIIGNNVTTIANGAFGDCYSLSLVYYTGSMEMWNTIEIGSNNNALNAASLYSDYLYYPNPELIFVSYAVEGGNLYFDPKTGEIKYCDEGVTYASIPNEIGGVPVTTIGNSAFAYRRDLTGVDAGDCVTKIGNSAFKYCYNLTNVTIPHSITSICDSAFYHCNNLTGMTIPDGITSISDYAFYYCNSLTGVTIPDSVTSIGDYAFYYCNSLTGVTIPDSVTSIGDSAFCACDSLTGVTIPNSVISIGDHAFSNCSSLTGVTIPDSVTSISDHTFSSCHSLTSVTIPDSITSIGDSAFLWCENLVDLTVPDSVTCIGNYAFSYCSSLTDVTIGNSVTSIGDSTFYNCYGLTNVTIPHSVTSIGDDAFSSCHSLTDVYYSGSEEQWNMIAIGQGNEPLLSATTTIHFNYTSNPSEPEPVENPFGDVKETDYYAEPVLWAVANEITNGTSEGKFSPERSCTRGQIVTFLWRAEGCPEPKSTENPFTDVSEKDYYYKAVLWAVEKEITTGTGKGKFSPERPCTRGQVATFLWRAAGKPAPASTDNPFSDIASTEYYYDAVLWAVENEITNGTGKGLFSPERDCTRGQIVTFLYRAIA